MAAELEAYTKLQRRGGAKKWKVAVKRRYSKELQKKKQQQRRHREKSRQIWARLQALVATVKTTESTLMQLADGASDARPHPPGKKLIEKSDGGPTLGGHWRRRNGYSEG